jgi:hypothetical protein
VSVQLQERLFAAPARPRPPAPLGPNQRDVLARIDLHGWVGLREAGRIVYANRGRNPERIHKDHLEQAGWRVLISLRKRGLIRSSRYGRWARRSPGRPA